MKRIFSVFSAVIFIIGALQGLSQAYAVSDSSEEPVLNPVCLKDATVEKGNGYITITRQIPVTVKPASASYADINMESLRPDDSGSIRLWSRVYYRKTNDEKPYKLLITKVEGGYYVDDPVVTITAQHAEIRCNSVGHNDQIYSKSLTRSESKWSWEQNLGWQYVTSEGMVGSVGVAYYATVSGYGTTWEVRSTNSVLVQ